jgi:putative ABC transport system permease protein
VDSYPNVSVIDVADIVRSVGRILSNITLAVSFIGGFVFLSGALILVGSIAMTKFQRVYEAAVLKTLGAKRRVLLSIMLAEYGLLGLVAGLVGAGAANGLSYAVARYVFEVQWGFSPSLNALGVAATVLLVGVVGALSSLDVLTKKPLSILRAQ